MYPQLDDCKWLYQHYWEKRETIAEISFSLSCNRKTTTRAFKKCGIRIQTAAEAAVRYYELNDGDWLYGMYIVEKRTADRISEILGCNHVTVLNALTRQNIQKRTPSEVRKGMVFSEGHKRKISEANKNPTEELREIRREIRKHIKYPTHHTKPEMIFEVICKKYNLPFKYVGDSSFWIGRKPALNPDFIHLTRKVVVEIFSWHHDELRNRHVNPTARYGERKRLLKKRGYKMIVF